MKKTAWIIYGVIIFILLISVLLGAIISNTALITTTIASIFTVIYLIGLYGYVFEKAIWNAGGWRFMFWLNIVGHGMRAILLIISPSTELLADTVISLILSIPLLYALYKYSSPAYSAWLDTHIGKQALLLEQLFNNKEQIETSVVTSGDNNHLKTSVKIQKDKSEFLVKIKKDKDGNIENFNNSFDNLHSVIRFIEGNTPIRASDFA